MNVVTGAALLQVAVTAGAMATPCRAAIFETPANGLETMYGGIIGIVFRDSPFDFGMPFSSVDSARLHLVGNTDLAGSTLTFTPVLDGQPSAPTQIISVNRTFEVELPLVVSASVLDGEGTVGLTLITFLPGTADLSSRVTEATLVFNGLPVCPTDINRDGLVDVLDLLELLANWGPAGGGGPGDVNNDGTVDVLDLLELLATWGPC